MAECGDPYAADKLMRLVTTRTAPFASTTTIVSESNPEG
jgi:hypothetical protein